MSRNPDAIVGKTIKAVSEDMYMESFILHFTDGTSVKVSAGTTGAHNERWSTVLIGEVQGEPVETEICPECRQSTPV